MNNGNYLLESVGKGNLAVVNTLQEKGINHNMTNKNT